MQQIQTNYKLNELNTLHLDSVADEYISLSKVIDLPKIIKHVKSNQQKFFVLGGGSNIILPKQYVGTVIHNQLLGINKLKEDSDSIWVKAMAGEGWDNFVAHTIDNGWFGLENLSLIPGTVGASPIQNIGAYGVEVKDFIDYVEVYDSINDRFIELQNHECHFSYRNSSFKTNLHLIVTSVVFKLRKIAKLNTMYADLHKQIEQIENPTPKDLRNCVIATRQSKLPDPTVIGNVGSFFHNPLLPIKQVNDLKSKYPNLPVYPINAETAKVSAGWLIDNLGLKGYRSGNIGTYPKQALVLVNHGGANADELLAFAQFLIDKVYTSYGITLHIEPIILV